MKKEVKQLLNKSHRALNAAKILLDQGDADFAVSRAYYAMFYAAEGLLLSKNLTASKHSGLLNLLFEHFVKPGHLKSSFHQDLHQLFDLRQEGYYWAESTITGEMAQEALETAGSFVTKMEECITQTDSSDL